jgi:transcriptional regulator with XRE-family HTH domain
MQTPALVNSPKGEAQEEQEKIAPEERLRSVRLHALDLVEQLQALAAEQPAERQPTWIEYIGMVQDVVHFAESSGTSVIMKRAGQPLSTKQMQEFGKLLRDKRNAAGFSRVQLARKAKLSDATIKFIETARHPPSRATLIRLIGVVELKLTWADVPGHPAPPAAERTTVVEKAEVSSELNCFITPTYDPVRMVMDLGRFLNGAGGHVEQTNAYLDHQSAAAYMAMCQQSAIAASLRASTPLAEAARRIVAASGQVGLNVIALGAGDATLEVRLVQHLIEEAHAPSIELCLLDISQPLLSCAYKHAADTLTGIPNVHVWGMQCNFHHMPLYTQLYYTPARLQRRRVFCMLGGTLANLDNEPRFFQHSLLGCSRGDLLLLDMQVARGSVDDPAEIKKRDKTWSSGVSPAHAAWLSGPIWRHCKDVLSVEFHWNLDTQCPVPGSYALDAVATVQSRGRADRQFSLFRFRRYDPSKLAECLSGLGWDEIGVMPYGGADQPASLRLFCKRSDGT